MSEKRKMIKKRNKWDIREKCHVRMNFRGEDIFVVSKKLRHKLAILLN